MIKLSHALSILLLEHKICKIIVGNTCIVTEDDCFDDNVCFITKMKWIHFVLILLEKNTLIYSIYFDTPHHLF